MHIGRNRYNSHAGIPHGSTNDLGDSLAFYLQHNVGITTAQWNDQSANNNHVTQSTSGDQAAISNGGLDFESSEADHYDFTSEIEISEEEGFVLFIVCEVESISTNMCVLGLNNAQHFLQFVAGGDNVSIKLSNTNTTITPSVANQFTASEGKFLLLLQREAGGTGNLNLYKNGVLVAQGSQAANTGDGEFAALGVRNADRYFDGVIYDVALVQGGAANRDVINRTTAYLKSKHGLN